MTLKEQYIYEIYKTRSFTKAANELFISQPTLSAMVKRAEEELGFAVFDRTVYPLGVTDLGQIYIEYLENCVNNEAMLQRRLGQVQNCVSGSIKIGASALNMCSLMPLFVDKMLKLHPDVNIMLYENNMTNLREKLKGGEVDLIIDNFEIDRIPAEIECTKLRPERILLAVPEGHAINEQLLPWKVSLKDSINTDNSTTILPREILRRVMDEQFIFTKQGYTIRHQVEKLFINENKELKTLLEFEQLATMIRFVQAGIGIGFISDIIAYSYDSYEGINFYTVIDGGERWLCAARKSGKYQTAAANEFTRIASKICRNSK